MIFFVSPGVARQDNCYSTFAGFIAACNENTLKPNVVVVSPIAEASAALNVKK